jgi:hypothetical protein
LTGPDHEGRGRGKKKPIFNVLLTAAHVWSDVESRQGRKNARYSAYRTVCHLRCHDRYVRSYHMSRLDLGSGHMSGRVFSVRSKSVFVDRWYTKAHISLPLSAVVGSPSGSMMHVAGKRLISFVIRSIKCLFEIRDMKRNDTTMQWTIRWWPDILVTPSLALLIHLPLCHSGVYNRGNQEKGWMIWWKCIESGMADVRPFEKIDGAFLSQQTCKLHKF